MVQGDECSHLIVAGTKFRQTGLLGSWRRARAASAMVPVLAADREKARWRLSTSPVCSSGPHHRTSSAGTVRTVLVYDIRYPYGPTLQYEVRYAHSQRCWLLMWRAI